MSNISTREELGVFYEKVRNGEVLCLNCGKPMEMYGKPTCFQCEKPKHQTMIAGDLGEAIRWLEVNEKGFTGEEFKDSMWSYLGSADSFIRLYFDDDNSMHQLFKKHFGDVDIWEISW